MLEILSMRSFDRPKTSVHSVLEAPPLTLKSHLLRYDVSKTITRRGCQAGLRSVRVHSAHRNHGTIRGPGIGTPSQVQSPDQGPPPSQIPETRSQSGAKGKSPSVGFAAGF